MSPGKQIFDVTPSTASMVNMSVPGGIKQVPIPIAGMSWPILVADFPMTNMAWESMLTLLKAMKPGLVIPSEIEPDEEKPK